MNQLKCQKIDELCATFTKYDIEIDRISIGSVVNNFLVIQCRFVQEVIRKHLAEVDLSYRDDGFYDFNKGFIFLVNSIFYFCGFNDCEECDTFGPTLDNCFIATIETDVRNDNLGDGLVFYNPKYADQSIQPYLVNVDVVNMKDGSPYKGEFIGLAETKVIELQDRFDLLDLK